MKATPRRVVAGTLLGMVAAVIGWGSFAPEPARTTDENGGGANAPPASQVASVPTLRAGASTPGADLDRVDTAGAPAPDAPAPPAAPAASAAASTHWDLCGVGMLPVVPDTPRLGDPQPKPWEVDQLPAPLGRDADAAWRPRWMATLRMGGPRQRAAALMLGDPMLVDLGVPYDAVRKLAALAMASGDPAVLRWASAWCLVERHGQACEVLPSDAWRRREPDNAAAWFAWAARVDAGDDALWAGLSRATRHAVYPKTLAATVLAAAPPEMPPYLRLAPVVDAIGIEAALVIQPMGRVLRSCQAPAVEKAGRREQCEHLARMQVERSDDWWGVMLGATLGRALGWPADRLDAVRAAQRASVDEAVALMPQQPYACEAIARISRWIERHAAEGEVPKERPWASPPTLQIGR